MELRIDQSTSPVATGLGRYHWRVVTAPVKRAFLVLAPPWL
jgi:hypothetical protein